MYCAAISHLIAFCQQRFPYNLQNIQENAILLYIAIAIDGFLLHVSGELDDFEYSW